MDHQRFFCARRSLPWFCALYIEEAYRGHAYGARLIAHVKTEAARLGYRKLYLCTDHTGYYEKYGFGYLGVASDPFGSSSRIYCAETQDDWDFLVTAAKAKLHPRTLSPFIDAGGVAAALLTEAGNVYTGVCIDTACSLGMCAERNAVASMITGGERRIVKLVCLMGDGSPGMPCGACRELLMQLDARSGDIEILVSYPDVHTVKLGDLMPSWWGTERFNEPDH
ncbi:MAG: GNAT family N-acetyltransferase [Victivallales bacterium]